MELHLRPLNQRLTIDAGANLLDTLREHGIPISYSCQSGQCGTCRCKVLSGDVNEVGPEHRRPNATPMAKGTVLACQTTLLSDCEIELPTPDEVVVHPARIIKGTVEAIEAATHDIRRLVIRPNKPLAYSPGQYTNVRFAPGLERPYSPAGLMSDDKLEYHIRILPDGRVTQHLEHNIKVGDSVRISGPLGTSYLRTRHDGPMLCVAGGTGLAPVLSIIRGALDAGMTQHPIHLFVGVRSERDVYHEAVLQHLARDYPCFHYEIVLSAPGGNTARSAGLVTDLVLDRLPDLSGWRAYLAGPPPMVEAATRLVVDHGVNSDHVYADAFYLASQ